MVPCFLVVFLSGLQCGYTWRHFNPWKYIKITSHMVTLFEPNAPRCVFCGETHVFYWWQEPPNAWRTNQSVGTWEVGFVKPWFLSNHAIRSRLSLWETTWIYWSTSMVLSRSNPGDFLSERSWSGAAVPRKKGFEFTWNLKEFSSLKWLGFRAGLVGWWCPLIPPVTLW